MKNLRTPLLIACIALLTSANIKAQENSDMRGYYDAPYTRYEADKAELSKATVLPQSFKQEDLQSEASDQVCVDMTKEGAAVEWNLTKEGDGLVVRYSVPDGEEGELDVYANDKKVGTMKLTSYWSWEYLWKDDNPNNGGVRNENPKMRFDEERLKLPSKISAGGTLKLVRKSGNITLDFAELEAVPEAVEPSESDVVYKGDGSDLRDFIIANGGDKTIYLPEGVYNVSSELKFSKANTTLKGAGSWYTQIHFTSEKQWDGGLMGNAKDISYSGLYLTTVRNSRSRTYKGINGVYTSGSKITDVWAVHFECGAWIANYIPGPIKFADGFVMSHCRLRNNYADGINLCKGTLNSIVEHTSFRNNGDDDMAIWSADGEECQNNIFRYNTSENCWRASGCAIYGGLNNQAHHLLIKDNLEVGIRVNNAFPGAPFNSDGMHVFSDITIISCGTFNDLFNNPVGAIDLMSTSHTAAAVRNVKFENIDIINSKNDAIYINRIGGIGFENFVFKNITIDGTGVEYPHNNVLNRDWGRGYGILFAGNPNGKASYSNIVYKNIGGNATSSENLEQKGSLFWTQFKSSANRSRKKSKKSRRKNKSIDTESTTSGL